jgi:hypothetical protein
MDANGHESEIKELMDGRFDIKQAVESDSSSSESSRLASIGVHSDFRGRPNPALLPDVLHTARLRRINVLPSISYHFGILRFRDFSASLAGSGT